MSTFSAGSGLSSASGGHTTQVPADWLALSGLGYIYNKPTNLSQFNDDLGISHVGFSGQYQDTLNHPTNLSQFNDVLGISTVGFTGQYSDTLNHPTNLSQFNDDLGISKAGFSGSYPDLINQHPCCASPKQLV